MILVFRQSSGSNPSRNQGVHCEEMDCWDSENEPETLRVHVILLTIKLMQESVGSYIH